MQKQNSVSGNYFSKTKADEQSDNEPNFQARFISGRSDTSERRRGHPGGISYNNNRSQECHPDHDRYSSEGLNMPPRNIGFCDMVPQDRPRDLLPRGGPLYYKGDDPYRSGPGFASPLVRERPDRNDCEIILISRVLIEYAEYIKKQLESVGLIIGLLFPNEDIPLGRVLADISSRGCLYAIFILPQNELHCSLTLSVLHGIPQEHQNIPVDDAIVLIIRDFDAYMRREKSTSTAATGAALLTDRHPEPIQILLNSLVKNCQIAAVQYDRLVKYIEERRELRSQYEITEGCGESIVELEPNSEQAELQSCIVSREPVCQMASDPGITPLAVPCIQETAVPEEPVNPEKKYTYRQRRNNRRVRIPTGKEYNPMMRRPIRPKAPSTTTSSQQPATIVKIPEQIQEVELHTTVAAEAQRKKTIAWVARQTGPFESWPTKLQEEAQGLRPPGIPENRRFRLNCKREGKPSLWVTVPKI